MLEAGLLRLQYLGQVMQTGLTASIPAASKPPTRAQPCCPPSCASAHTMASQSFQGPAIGLVEAHIAPKLSPERKHASRCMPCPSMFAAAEQQPLFADRHIQAQPARHTYAEQCSTWPSQPGCQAPTPPCISTTEAAEWQRQQSLASASSLGWLTTSPHHFADTLEWPRQQSLGSTAAAGWQSGSSPWIAAADLMGCQHQHLKGKGVPQYLDDQAGSRCGSGASSTSRDLAPPIPQLTHPNLLVYCAQRDNSP